MQYGKSGEIYNIGSNNEKTNLEVAHLILNALNEKTYGVEFVKNRMSNDKRYSINYDKIAKELNYSPVYNFENSLDKIVEWYKQKITNFKNK